MTPSPSPSKMGRDGQETVMETSQSAIADLASPLVARYFDYLNGGNLAATAALFGDRGAMQPPFEEPIVGAEEILAYLQDQAVRMKLAPDESQTEPLEEGRTGIWVRGIAQTPLFEVNVAWYFVLEGDRLVYLRIKLLASPEELVMLRNQGNS